MWGFAVLGGVLVALAVIDAALTVLHPAGRGPVTLVATTGVWTATRAGAGALGRRGLLMAAGPLAVLTVLGAWVALLWLGFALVYFAFLEDLSFSPSVSYDDPGFLDALYLSATSLTTVGFGDVVGGTDWLRLTTTLEAATGFGVITAAVTYLLSLYPLVSQVRATARTLDSQADDAARAAELVVAGGTPYLQALQERLIALDEDTHRFPLLHYFHPRDRAVSLATLLRGATMVCLQARWGLSDDGTRGTRAFGEELHSTIDRIVENYVQRAGFGVSAELEREIGLEDARERFRRLVDAAGDAGRREPPVEEELEGFAAFVGRAEAFLDHLGDRHLFPQGRLLAPD